MRKNITALQQEQIVEAETRMKMLSMNGNVIREFKSGKLNLSENGGILYWLDDEEMAKVQVFEKQHECIVYHVIKNNMEFGLCYSYLFVSKHKKEWPTDRKGLVVGEQLVYVYNKDEPMFIEFGYIGVKPSIGGLRRTY